MALRRTLWWDLSWYGRCNYDVCYQHINDNRLLPSTSLTLWFKISGLPSQKGTMPVQVGVYYSPKLHFAAFDIAVSCVAEGKPSRQYLPITTTIDLCKRCGIFSVDILKIGSLAECDSFPIRFNSTIPDRLGLTPPKIHGHGAAQNNIAEGVVIRCNILESRIIDNSAPPGPGQRLMYKKKCREFSERNCGAMMHREFRSRRSREANKSQNFMLAQSSELLWYTVETEYSCFHIYFWDSV